MQALSFRVAWLDDKGISRVNRGYRYQYSSALGPFVVSMLLLSWEGWVRATYPCIAVNKLICITGWLCKSILTRGPEVRDAAVVAVIAVIATQQQQQLAVSPCVIGAIRNEGLAFVRKGE